MIKLNLKINISDPDLQSHILIDMKKSESELKDQVVEFLKRGSVQVHMVESQRKTFSQEFETKITATLINKE